MNNSKPQRKPHAVNAGRTAPADNLLALPQKKVKAARTAAAAKYQKQVGTKQRILALLTNVVCERCGIYHETVMNEAMPEWKHPTWSRFLKGEISLPEQGADRLEQFLKRQIRKEVAQQAEDGENRSRHPLLRDLCYLRSRVFSEIDTDYLALTGRDDMYQLDRELLYALDIERRSQNPSKVQTRAHGFWYVVRRSTFGDKARAGEPEYCVSLLSVNSCAYMRLMGEVDREKREVPVKTSLAHFSLRTGTFDPENVSEERIYRGHVVQSAEPKSVLNFIGTDGGDSPPIFLMTLRLNEHKKSHATEAHGVIVTTNAETIISGPVGACAIPLLPEIAKKRDELGPVEYATNVEISKLYRAERKKLECFIGRYDRDRLFTTLEPRCADNSLRNVVRRLEKARDDASKGACSGFYFVPNA